MSNYNYMKRPEKPIAKTRMIYKSKIDDKFYDSCNLDSRDIKSISLKDIDLIKKQYPGYNYEIEPIGSYLICVKMTSILSEEAFLKYEEDLRIYNEWSILNDLNVARSNAEIALKRLEAAQAAVANIGKINDRNS